MPLMKKQIRRGRNPTFRASKINQNKNQVFGGQQRLKQVLENDIMTKGGISQQTKSRIFRAVGQGLDDKMAQGVYYDMASFADAKNYLQKRARETDSISIDDFIQNKMAVLGTEINMLQASVINEPRGTFMWRAKTDRINGMRITRENDLYYYDIYNRLKDIVNRQLFASKNFVRQHDGGFIDPQALDLAPVNDRNYFNANAPIGQRALEAAVDFNNPHNNNYPGVDQRLGAGQGFGENIMF